MSKVLIAALVGVTCWFLQLVGGELEGRFYPVVGTAQIDRVEVATDVSTRIWGMAERLRNCSFKRLEWRLGDGRAFSVVQTGGMA